VSFEIQKMLPPLFPRKYLRVSLFPTAR